MATSRAVAKAFNPDVVCFSIFTGNSVRFQPIENRASSVFLVRIATVSPFIQLSLTDGGGLS
ncbi:MAG: hypothetical protein AAFX95_20500, partial [Cyanobacteria bacterium J06639_16]